MRSIYTEPHYNRLCYSMKYFIVKPRLEKGDINPSENNKDKEQARIQVMTKSKFTLLINRQSV